MQNLHVSIVIQSKSCRMLRSHRYTTILAISWPLTLTCQPPTKRFQYFQDSCFLDVWRFKIKNIIEQQGSHRGTFCTTLFHQKYSSTKIQVITWSKFDHFRDGPTDRQVHKWHAQKQYPSAGSNRGRVVNKLYVSRVKNYAWWNTLI